MINQFTPDHQHWENYVTHLERHNMARWVLSDDHQPQPDHLCLGAISGNHDVIGNLVLAVQPITFPETEWGAGHGHALTGPDGIPLRETFIATFAVDEAYRRQGYGRALQCAALDLTRELGCYQMRSWSSLDKVANFALKFPLWYLGSDRIDNNHVDGV